MYADERGKDPFVSLNSRRMFRKWVVKNSGHFPTGSPRDEKRRRYNVFSVSQGSVTTALLEDTMRPDRPRSLRGRQTRDQRNKRWTFWHIESPKVSL
ncbi:hypothetical protein TNCV_3195511 [Trichonephila clavipes]|nr:hypothetical protein TNCV_3195511 [Trichonephila clavipes]